MGEVTEMMVDGVLCEICGAYIDGPAPGHPRRCCDCDGGTGRTHPCPRCRRVLRGEQGLRDHMRDAHGEAT